MEREPFRQRRSILGAEQLVCLRDRRVEDFRADAVALTRLLADATGEYEVVRQLASRIEGRD
ncbi:MAG TPA: hypothetical protein VGH58_02390 [Solirubrobacterales bacterium]